MERYPLVSVIIPAYNRANLIERALKSILNQTYKNLEIIIVDDGSTDNTEEKIKLIKDERIKYFKSEKNMGVSNARNKGVKLSSGGIIVLQDSDDEALPERVEKQVNLLLNSPENVGAVYCGREFYNSNTGEKTGVNLMETDFKKNFTEGSYFLTPSTSTLVIRKAVLEQEGYFDERLRAHVDTELAIRVSKKYDYAFVNEPLVKVYRYHEQIMGNARNYILAKEVIYEKHKDYLSRKILYGLCKMIANYYILTKDPKKAKEYLKKSFSYKFDLLSLFLYIGVSLSPSLAEYILGKKYNSKIPLTSGLE